MIFILFINHHTKIIIMSIPKNKKGKQSMDLPDSEKDKKQLKPDEGTLDLPDVDDIPGQEHIRPMRPGGLSDVTISSADEEGEGLFEEEDELVSEDSNVSSEEKELLAQTDVSMSTDDDISLRRAKVDRTDEEGIPLNEVVDQSGSDLDVPGSEEDEEEDETENDDEENDSYSLNDDKEDPVNTRQ